MLYKLISPPKTSARLIYLPGTDGTGLSITSQLENLDAYEVYSLFIPPSNRDTLLGLSDQIIALIKALPEGPPPSQPSSHPLQHRGGPGGKGIILVGESFGGVVALMVASRCPEIFESLVLINPACNFRDSLGGLPGIFSQTSLLSSFPNPLYVASQAVLLPFMFDATRIKHSNLPLVKKMMDLEPPIHLTDHGSELEDSSQPLSSLPPSFLPDGLRPSEAAAAASHRCSLLQQFSLNNLDLSNLGSLSSTLIVSSARDRLLPSLSEGSRLLREIPNSNQVILPLSGHACLLEQDVDLGSILENNLNLANLKTQPLNPTTVSETDPFALWTHRLAG